MFRIFQGGRSTLVKRMQNKSCSSERSDVHLMTDFVVSHLFLFSVCGAYNIQIRPGNVFVFSPMQSAACDKFAQLKTPK